MYLLLQKCTLSGLNKFAMNIPTNAEVNNVKIWKNKIVLNLCHKN